LFNGRFEAYKSLQKAINNASYGDTILIREGFFRDTINVNINGDNLGYLTIKNYKDEKVVIDGNNTHPMELHYEKIHDNGDYRKLCVNA